LRCQEYIQYALDHPGLYRLMLSPDLPALDPAMPGGGPAGAAETAPSTAALTGLAAGINRCSRRAVPLTPPTRPGSPC